MACPRPTGRAGLGNRGLSPKIGRTLAKYVMSPSPHCALNLGRMSSQNPSTPPPPPVKLDYVAGLLSYLIPGLGQLTQGRVRKGLLFLVCLYTLFFYGMYLGIRGQNVYLPDNHKEDKSDDEQAGIGHLHAVPVHRSVSNWHGRMARQSINNTSFT